MPELPEVETIAADLRQQLPGRRFLGAHVTWSRTLSEPSPEDLAIRLAGRQVTGVRRRGKYLLIDLDSGDSLIIHLRMTGRLAIVADGDPLLQDAHLRVRFPLADGHHLVFVDARKFGRVWLVPDAGAVAGKLGPEPLAQDFQPAMLGERLRKRRAAVKALLLDQRVLAGIGNIYADEALFLARIHPLRPGASLSDEEVQRLHEAIRRVLTEAIGQRGTLLRDYRTPYGRDGAYQNHLRVYHRAGHPCPRCGAPIQQMRVTQRSTHFCPACQPEPSTSRFVPGAQDATGGRARWDPARSDPDRLP